MKNYWNRPITRGNCFVAGLTLMLGSAAYVLTSAGYKLSDLPALVKDYLRIKPTPDKEEE